MPYLPVTYVPVVQAGINGPYSLNLAYYLSAVLVVQRGKLSGAYSLSLGWT